MINAARADLDIHPDRRRWRPNVTPMGLIGAGNLAEALTDRARREPSAVAYYLPDEADGADRVTVAELYERASTAGAVLGSAGLGSGGRACLCLDTSPELLAALFGTTLIGAVAMLTEPPFTASRRGGWLDRLHRVVEVARPTVVVCAQELRAVAEAEVAPQGIAVVCPPFSHGTAATPVLDAAPEDPVIVQFTSGTTSAAKGIVLSQRGLLAAAAAIGQATPFLRGDVVVSWLPLYHDMGLVGSTLSTFLHGVPTVLIKPMSFGTRPLMWLRTLHRYRGTISAAPNFAYQLAISRARQEDLHGLDLSSWRTAFNGAEVVDANTIRDFQRVLRPYGLCPQSVRPCYGMAEVGLAATFAPPDRLARMERLSRAALSGRGVAEPALTEADTQELVSSGSPLPGTKIRIVDVDGCDLPDGRVGQILLASASMMTGYLASPGESVQELRDGWLNTGDLGFRLDGELFVTGRSKDVIIIAGRNYHPQLFELAAVTAEGVRFNSAAAIGLRDEDAGTERLVIVVETRCYDDAEQARQVRKAVEQAVANGTGVSPDRVVTVKPGGLPRTSSGKMRRHVVATMLAASPGTEPSMVRAG